MTPASTSKLDTSDVERWRQNIRAYTFGHYCMEMGWSILERERNFQAVVEHFERALTFEAENPLAHWLLVESLRAAGKGDQSKAAHERALAIDPNYQESGLAIQAIRQLREGNRAGAEEALVQLEQHASEVPSLFACRRLFALSDGRMPPEFAGMPTPPLAPAVVQQLGDGIMEIASRLGQAGKPGLAEVGYRWLLGMSPDRPDVYSALSSLLRDQTNYKDLLEIAARGIELEPNDITQRTQFGLACMIADPDWTRAHAQLNAILAISPDHVIALINSWYVRIASGYPLDVATEIQGRLTGQSQNELYKSWLLLALHVAGDVAGALSVGQKLSDGYRRQPNNMRYMALELYDLDRADTGIALLEEGRPGLPPENPRNRVVWAYLLARRGEMDRAIATIEATVDGLSDSYFELTCLALLRETLGESEMADQLYRKAFSMKPKRQWLMARLLSREYAHLDRTYRRLGLAISPHWPEEPHILS